MPRPKGRPLPEDHKRRISEGVRRSLTRKYGGDVMERREHEHSPIPWKWVDRSEHSDLASKDSPIPFSIYRESDTHYAVEPIADICNFPPATPEQTARQRANAELIVQAVNQHTTLVEQRDHYLQALEETRSTLGGLRNHLRPGEDSRAKDYVDYMVKRIDSALATVEQGGDSSRSD